jgi:hypothetical protein
MSLEDVRDFEKRMQEETNEKVRGPSCRCPSVRFFISSILCIFFHKASIGLGLK